MTRLAVLSDIHGNLPALEAVLHDIQRRGTPDCYWVLGDLTAYFPWSAEVVARVRALPDTACLQGNLDRYMITGYRPAVPVTSTEVWARMAALLAVREARFQWAVERLPYADYVYLRDLPEQLTCDIPGYGRITAVHAAPGDDETDLPPDAPDDVVRPHLAGLKARLLLYGHTHQGVDRVVDGIRLINPGSVGLPLDGDPRAAYALLDFEAGNCMATLCRVAYDVEAVTDAMAALAYPAYEHLARILLSATR